MIKRKVPQGILYISTFREIKNLYNNLIKHKIAIPVGKYPLSIDMGYYGLLVENIDIFTKKEIYPKKMYVYTGKTINKLLIDYGFGVGGRF